MRQKFRTNISSVIQPCKPSQTPRKARLIYLVDDYENELKEAVVEYPEEVSTDGLKQDPHKPPYGPDAVGKPPQNKDEDNTDYGDN